MACALVDTGATPTVSDGNGNTWKEAVLRSVTLHGASFCWYAANANAGATTVTISGSGISYIAMAIEEVSGVATADPVDAIGSSTGTGGTVTVSTGYIPTTNDYIVAFAGDWDGNATFTAGAGYTIRQQVNDATNGDAIALFDKDTKTNLSGVQTATVTKTQTGHIWVAVIVAFRGANSAPSNPSLVQSVSNPSITYNACSPVCYSYTFTTPATAAGNLLVVGMYGNCVGGVIDGLSDNAGNTYLSAESANLTGGGQTMIWYVPAALGGATTVTIQSQCSNASPTIWFAEFSGMQTGSSVLDTFAAAANQSSSTTVTAPSVTTTTAKSVVISVATGNSNLSGLQGGSPFTVGATVGKYGMAYYIPTSTGSYSAVWTQSPTATYSAVTAAFKPR